MSESLEQNFDTNRENSVTQMARNNFMKELMADLAYALKKPERCPGNSENGFLSMQDAFHSGSGDKTSGGNHPSGSRPAGISESPTTNPAPAADTAAPKKSK
ncbi:MAG TPA: hypothetical protein V6C97_19015 [Oculatellaceae cyanobacterium]